MDYLLDTDWAIQSLGGYPPASSLLRRIPRRQVGISIVTVGEMYDGAFNSSNPQANLDRLRRFLMVYTVLPITDTIMERFAEIRAFLRRQGQIIPDFDIVIAATALYYDLTVLTFNVRHFARVPDLRLYQPA